MQKFPVYRYTRPDGGVSVSPVKPDGECIELTRMVADDGNTITDGVTVATCVDTDNPDAWQEIEGDLTAEESLAIITGGSA